MRLVAAAVAIGALGALLLGACETDSSDWSERDTHDAVYDGCRQFPSCGTCTPVSGCGWCFNADGTGLCAAGPDECPTPVFSWTWNPSGCRIPADAGAGPVAVNDDAALAGDREVAADSGTDASSSDESTVPESGSSEAAAEASLEPNDPIEVPQSHRRLLPLTRGRPVHPNPTESARVRPNRPDASCPEISKSARRRVPESRIGGGAMAGPMASAAVPPQRTAWTAPAERAPRPLRDWVDGLRARAPLAVARVPCRVGRAIGRLRDGLR